MVARGTGVAGPAAWGLPGTPLGMPREGAGAIGRFGRRLLGVVIDWTLCQLIAYALFGVPVFQPAGAGIFVVLGNVAVEHLAFVGTLGFTIGHRVFGLQVPPSAAARLARSRSSSARCCCACSCPPCSAPATAAASTTGPPAPSSSGADDPPQCRRTTSWILGRRRRGCRPPLGPDRRSDRMRHARRASWPARPRPTPTPCARRTGRSARCRTPRQGSPCSCHGRAYRSSEHRSLL